MTKYAVPVFLTQAATLTVEAKNWSEAAMLAEARTKKVGFNPDKELRNLTFTALLVEHDLIPEED
jgi:hypothetical protein